MSTETYEDSGYSGDVPRTAAQQAPNAEIWRRTIVVTSHIGKEITGLVSVTARWEYKIGNGSEWKIATERKLQVPINSLGGRFTKLDTKGSE